MFQISVNNFTSMNVMYSSNDLFEDVVSLALWQLVNSLFTQVVEEVTTLHVFGHDECLGLNRKLFDDFDYVGVVDAHIHSLSFTERVFFGQTLIIRIIDCFDCDLSSRIFVLCNKDGIARVFLVKHFQNLVLVELVTVTLCFQDSLQEITTLFFTLAE